jgi:hypothetical protein
VGPFLIINTNLSFEGAENLSVDNFSHVHHQTKPHLTKLRFLNGDHFYIYCFFYSTVVLVSLPSEKVLHHHANPPTAVSHLMAVREHLHAGHERSGIPTLRRIIQPANRKPVLRVLPNVNEPPQDQFQMSLDLA